MSATRRMHLISNQTYDEAEVWCGSEDTYKSEHEPEVADCHECLIAARRFGDRCAVRREQLLADEARSLRTKDRS